MSEIKRRIRKLEQKQKPRKRYRIVQQRDSNLFDMDGTLYKREDEDMLIIFDESVSDL